MTARATPPFRADHVGSFLRPKFLLEARERKAKGEITAAQLREVEDRAITDIVRFQQDVGLQSITDGEFRRTYFHIVGGRVPGVQREWIHGSMNTQCIH